MSYGLPGIAAEIHLPYVLTNLLPSYGLPGIAAEIHWRSFAGLARRRYGLPGIAAEIHWIEAVDTDVCAMVCRESRLRYTSADADSGLITAMVCRESRLRYTLS